MKTLNSKVIFKNSHGYKLHQDKIKRDNGVISDYEYLERTPGYVGILAVDKSSNIYLVKNYRYPVKEEFLELPMGYIQKGEKPLDAAKRELKEEIGATSSNWTEIQSVWIAPGVLKLKCHIYMAKDILVGKSSIEDDEDISNVEVLSNYKDIKFKELVTQFAVNYFNRLMLYVSSTKKLVPS